MINQDLLKMIYTEDSNSNCLVFRHTGKTWVMPEDAVKGAMDMYQPSSCGGESIKKNIIKKHKVPFYARGSEIKQEKIEIEKSIERQLQDLLGIRDFHVATYMGEMWTTQNDKAVLQIYSNDEIYAYVKVTTDEENAKRFEKESKALNKLRDAGIEYIPRVIGLDLNSKMKMLAQSSDKQFGQKVKLDFNARVLDTIKHIVEKTKKDIDYKNSDFYRSIEFLKKQMDVFDQEQQSIVEEGIKITETADVTFAFSHGDFTPWNIYYDKNENIQLFDLEYCSGSMPAYVDVFHYLSQMTLLGRRYTAQCVMREYEHQLELISEYVDDPRTTFICYLAWVISFYIKRAEGNIDRIRKALDVWVEMLEYLIKYLK